MKFALALLGSLLLLDLACGHKFFTDKFHECAKEAGISPDELKEHMKGNVAGSEHCIASCFLKKLDVLENGKISKDKIAACLAKLKDTLPNISKMEEVTNSCYDKVTAEGDMEECELSTKFTNCVHSSIQD